MLGSPSVHMAYVNFKVVMKMNKKKSPLRLGKETYGTLKIEEAFKKALEPYFAKQDLKIQLNSNVMNEQKVI